MSNVRLYVDHPLGAGQTVPLTRDQAHYLFGVMRLSPGSDVSIFNGEDGEWRATVAEAGKRGGTLFCAEKTADTRIPPDLWLMFAPIKKARTDFIVEKAAELGARGIYPVQTEYTQSDRIRQDRLQSHAVEAAEQCGGTFVPKVSPLVRLSAMLDRWPEGRRLLFCDEALAGDPQTELRDLPKGPWAILVGPEGGFSTAERELLRGLRMAHPISLGPRVLRADTAVVAALVLWQSALGDWG